MKISAIVSVYNPESKVIQNIYAISNQASRVFICDNSKENNDRLFLQFKNVIYIFNNENLGLSQAFNKVLKNEKYDWENDEYVIFFDQDSLISECHVEKLIRIFNETKNEYNIGCIGPVYFETNSKQIKTPIIKKKLLNSVYKVKTIITSSLLTQYKILKEIDFWNEKIFLDLSDWDLCWRLSKANYVICLTDELCLKHTLGVGANKLLKEDKPFRTYYQIRDSLYLLHKNYTPIKYKIRFLLNLTLRIILHLLFLPNKTERFYYYKLAIEHHYKLINGALRNEFVYKNSVI